MIDERASSLRLGLQARAAASTTRSRLIALTSILGVGAAATALTLEPRFIAVAGAVAVGWSHLAGRCGASHFGTLTPRGKLRGRRASWAGDAIVYTAAGAISSTVVGASLGAAGGALPDGFREVAIAGALLLAVVAAAIDLRLLPARLPEPPWQTRRQWGQAFRRPIPAVMWGFCLGITVATVFTFSGAWVVLAVPVALGDPGLGAMVLLAHWLGRAIPVLAGPFLLDDPGRTLQVLDDIDDARPVFRASSVVGIATMGFALAILLKDVAP